MVLPARRRRGILLGAVAASVGVAGLEGVGMGRLGWVQHLMAGIWVERDSAKYRGLSAALRCGRDDDFRRVKALLVEMMG
jgi:hypothetical protein